MSRAVIVGLIGAIGAGCAAEATESADRAVQSASIMVTPKRTAISEAGDPAFVTVALGAMPRGPLRVNIVIDPPTEAVASPASLLFMPNDWAPQTITLAAVDDAAFDGDISLSVTLDVTTHDPRYAGLADPVVSVLSVDDDYVVTGYTMRELYPGSAGSNPIALNNRGQAVADVRYGVFDLHAYIWEDGVITNLGHPTRANDLNDDGSVVGFLDHDQFSFRYDEGGQVMPFDGYARGISDRGHVVGDALYANGERIELNGGQPLTGIRVNSRDRVTGLFPVEWRERAFFWDGTFVNLGSFGGPRAAGLSINEADQVVGYMWDPEIRYHAFLYDRGVITDLGTATGKEGHGAAAVAINNLGDIAGYDHDGGLPTDGWVGRPGALRTIKSLLVDGSCFHQIEVIDMNDRGQILGRAFECHRGSPHSYIFDPVKAPR